ncbi:MAG: DNA alkylation repair protein [Acutalibacteraceae bacterium]
MDVKQELKKLAESDYKKFNAKLIPNIDPESILGVRIPAVRKLAKELARGDYRTYLETAEADTFEEVMLQGLVIGQIKADINTVLEYVKSFVPKIDNWAVCDCFCAGLKIANKNKALVLEFIKPYLNDKREFFIRFGVIMLLDYFICDEYIENTLALLDCVSRKDYYVQMGVAWALSVCFVKYRDLTLKYLQGCTLDDFTFNKTLQKITESNRVCAEDKALIRSMKRKGGNKL